MKTNHTLILLIYMFILPLAAFSNSYDLGIGGTTSLGLKLRFLSTFVDDTDVEEKGFILGTDIDFDVVDITLSGLFGYYFEVDFCSLQIYSIFGIGHGNTYDWSYTVIIPSCTKDKTSFIYHLGLGMELKPTGYFSAKKVFGIGTEFGLNIMAKYDNFTYPFARIFFMGYFN